MVSTRCGIIKIYTDLPARYSDNEVKIDAIVKLQQAFEANAEVRQPRQ